MEPEEQECAREASVLPCPSWAFATREGLHWRWRQHLQVPQRIEETSSRPSSRCIRRNYSKNLPKTIKANDKIETLLTKYMMNAKLNFAASREPSMRTAAVAALEELLPPARLLSGRTAPRRRRADFAWCFPHGSSFCVTACLLHCSAASSFAESTHRRSGPSRLRHPFPRPASKA